MLRIIGVLGGGHGAGQDDPGAEGSAGSSGCLALSCALHLQSFRFCLGGVALIVLVD